MFLPLQSCKLLTCLPLSSSILAGWLKRCNISLPLSHDIHRKSAVCTGMLGLSHAFAVLTQAAITFTLQKFWKCLYGLQKQQCDSCLNLVEFSYLCSSWFHYKDMRVNFSCNIWKEHTIWCVDAEHLTTKYVSTRWVTSPAQLGQTMTTTIF